MTSLQDEYELIGTLLEADKEYQEARESREVDRERWNAAKHKRTELRMFWRGVREEAAAKEAAEDSKNATAKASTTKTHKES